MLLSGISNAGRGEGSAICRPKEPANQNLLLIFCVVFVLPLVPIILHECCLCDEKGQVVILRETSEHRCRNAWFFLRSQECMVDRSVSF